MNKNTDKKFSMSLEALINNAHYDLAKAKAFLEEEGEGALTLEEEELLYKYAEVAHTISNSIGFLLADNCERRLAEMYPEDE